MQPSNKLASKRKMGNWKSFHDLVIYLNFYKWDTAPPPSARGHSLPNTFWSPNHLLRFRSNLWHASRSLSQPAGNRDVLASRHYDTYIDFVLWYIFMLRFTWKYLARKYWKINRKQPSATGRDGWNLSLAYWHQCDACQYWIKLRCPKAY